VTEKTENTVRVYRVENPVSGDYIATSWEEVCVFLQQECEPWDADDPDSVGDGDLGIRVTAEHWTPEAIAALGEWNP
jgi:hypothetical protein